MNVISVSKTYKHRGNTIKHRRNTKKVWQVMYYDYINDNFVLCSQYVSWFTVWFWKLLKKKQHKFTCPYCEQEYIHFYKFFQNEDCPNCD